MCACQGPAGRQGTPRVLALGTAARPPPSESRVPIPLFSKAGGRHRQRVRVYGPNPCFLSATWLPGAARSPPAGPEARTAAGSQTDTSSPAVPLEASRVAAPPQAWLGAPGWRPPNPSPSLHSPPERAPASCDWLIQTHLQRNASLRVLVGVQFKSAAPGAQGRAGAGSEDDSCAGASPRAAVGFLKRVFGGGGQGASSLEYPLRVQRSSPQSL